MTARRFVIAIATPLVGVLVGASPAAASIPCSTAAITKIVRLHRFELKGRRVLIDAPRYKPADPNCCPSLGSRTESATCNGRRFVRRLVAVRRP